MNVHLTSLLKWGGINKGEERTASLDDELLPETRKKFLLSIECDFHGTVNRLPG